MNINFELGTINNKAPESFLNDLKTLLNKYNVKPEGGHTISAICRENGRKYGYVIKH